MPTEVIKRLSLYHCLPRRQWVFLNQTQRMWRFRTFEEGFAPRVE